jgi:hypothetical protein
MPTGEHESPIALAKLDPGLVTWLLAHLFDVEVPDYHHARAQPTEVQVLVPRTYHADGMLLFCDAADRPVLAVVLEVQRGWDAAKGWTWKLYVAQLEAELNISAVLLVYCPNPMIAARYRTMREFEGPSLALRPLIFTPHDVPLVIDVELARSHPALAVFSAICHGADEDVDAAFPALAKALETVGPKRAILYYDIVLAGLPRAPRTRWEDFMTTTSHRYYSERFRAIETKAWTENGHHAVLTVLDARGIKVPDAVREQILACTDLDLLDTWLRRAVTVSTAEDVVRA